MNKYFILFLSLLPFMMFAQSENNSKVEIDQILSENNCQQEDLLIKIESPQLTVININPKNCDLPSEHLYYLGILIGTHYLKTTHITGASSEMLKLKNNKMIYHISLDYGTNRLLRLDAADYFQHLTLGVNYHIAKSSFFIGGNLQILNINNNAIGENGSHKTYAGVLASAGYQKLFLNNKLIIGAKFNYGVIKYFDSLANVSGFNINIGWKIIN